MTAAAQADDSGVSASAGGGARWSRLIGAALAWTLAGLGAICLVLTAIAALTDIRPLIVKTGSMAPSLPVGTVVLVRSVDAAEAARPGAVVAVVQPGGRRILHRVRRARPAGGSAMTLVLRGDRNRADDPPVTVSRVERPLLTVPGVGRPLTWLGGRWSQFWLGVAAGLAAALLARVLRPRSRRLAAPPVEGAPS